MKKKFTNDEYEDYRVRVFEYIDKLDKEIRKLRKEITSLKSEKENLEFSLKKLGEENNRFNQINTGKGLYYDITMAPVKLRNEISYLEKLSSFEYLSKNDKEKYAKRIEELNEELIKADAKAKELTTKEGEIASSFRAKKDRLNVCKKEIKSKENTLAIKKQEKQKYLNIIKKVDNAASNNKGVNPKLILEPNKN